MAKTVTVTLCLLLGLFVSVSFAAETTVFGTKDIEISWLHAHFSMHQFTVDDPGAGTIIITKNTPEKQIRGGFVFFNQRYISIRSFLREGDTVFKKDISLKSNNKLTVFLRGTSGASITLAMIKESSSQPPAPEVTFSADPETTLLNLPS